MLTVDQLGEIRFSLFI